MDNPQQKSEQIRPSPRDHLANERTFLAWIRTSIAIMGFGFVVVKFSIFIHQLGLTVKTATTSFERGYSAEIGLALIIIGAVLGLCAFFRYRTIEKHLETGRFYPSYALSLLTTIFIVAISLLLIIYLLPNLNK